MLYLDAQRPAKRRAWKLLAPFSSSSSSFFPFLSFLSLYSSGSVKLMMVDEVWVGQRWNVMMGIMCVQFCLLSCRAGIDRLLGTKGTRLVGRTNGEGR